MRLTADERLAVINTAFPVGGIVGGGLNASHAGPTDSQVAEKDVSACSEGGGDTEETWLTEPSEEGM